MPTKAIIGSVSRYVTGRNGLQTVYWKTRPYDSKMIKLSKTLHFTKKVENPVKFG